VPVTVSGAQGTVDGRIKVHTDDGPTITCRKVVMATGYETSPGIPRRSFDIVSSWAIATQPISPARLWHERCLVWEAADPYLYMRTTVDNRILVGGEDSALRSPVRRASAIAAKSKKLLDKAVELTGLADLKIDYAWAGAFAENPKGMPVFRPLQELPGSYAVLGCGGNGITFSMIGAQIVSARIAGRTDKDALLFDS
jgi:glycine/D-amino acid oxidase-like deaminating enzyme